ncbi:AraC family transcriptional regulator, regulatory protein of adaptative response / methylated-DNA-[protein]-cysteine methyltransferase [Singulisphaera sp. GP187]|uniref:bifunctional DNA-binding transcriptional regulator/O6-methylguanine-DNA methyltransferase Ada n=1 Tax=Singulisphaera sp. GP187 TaxID=1882752 RepID=UPI0009292A98|nr:bifunctional DNA-binding transcriptional regulator/O6-methylguanine-DNA methyltransferase Ada [Singulisphaera sp. GP187]SIO60844.1 AraC family transcriptional regulator, regulatory protein of adaptative response / methylated-DNA-[protein]-cysteine methyltransferase [Singulisphaera sp. GP187]
MTTAIERTDAIASPFSNDEARWQAVVDRNPVADGTFYYSVRTTGVYCKPSCAARSALRKNVRFHATCQDAESAGFRACKRCKPTEKGLAERQAAMIAQACRTIEAADEVPSLDELATSVGMSRYHFHRIFKEQTGLTPKGYASAHRAQRVRAALTRSPTVTQAIYGAGFNSNSRFYESSTEVLGMTPTAFRAGGTGASIRFAIGECWLGSILVAASDKGVCAILLGDDPDELAHDLQDRFPKAQLIGGDADFEQWVAKVVGFLETPSLGLDLPLDIRGTAFQQRVWDALRAIPAGSTATYAEIANQIGQPKAVRAVAQACAANALAVAIPCHRVVRTDGSLSGYRWGVERKSRLLRREQGAS